MPESKPKIKLTNDYLFKWVMVGHKKSEKVLLAFLNAIMQDAYNKTIASVKVLNPELLPENIADKKFVLDIYALTFN